MPSEFTATPRLAAFISPDPQPALLEVGGTAGTLLDAGRRCIVRLGAGHVRMVEVANLAGVSRATLYKHYPDLDALVGAVVDVGFALFVADLDEAMAAEKDLEAQLVAAALMAETWIRGNREASLFAQPEVLLASVRPAGSIVGQMAGVIERYLTIAEARGELRPGTEIPMAAEWVAAVLSALVGQQLTTVDLADPDALASFIRRHLPYGLMKPRRPRKTD